MSDRNPIPSVGTLSVNPEEGRSTEPEVRNQTTRRGFLQAAGLGAAALAAQGMAYGQNVVVDKDGNPIQGFEDNEKASEETSRGWEPVSDRKIRMGIVGFGFCQFGAAFGFQDHPNVEIVAVSDLIPDRCAGLAKACRCEKTYPSLEELVKDDSIEAVFCATDPPRHVKHVVECMKHGKHVATTVPACWGSLEEADLLYEVVKEHKGLQYMMFETSYFHRGLWAMRRLYEAGCFGEHISSEGEYYHYHDGKEPVPSFEGWRDGPPPLWYPTHASAFYVGVTGGSFTHVSCHAKPSTWKWLQPGGNKFNNLFSTETGLFRTSDGGSCRIACSFDTPGHEGEKGRFRGELGSFEEVAGYGETWGKFQAKGSGATNALPDLRRPPLPPTVDPGGHGGSHGHLMNEFVTAILENRTPICNVADALNMTVAGIAAHLSAEKDGELLKVPQYTMWT